MNDSLKCRVWDIENGVYYDFSWYVNNCQTIFNEMEYNLNPRYIVERCTGLRDKNGVLIFECDVLKDSRLHGKNCTVVYDNNLCRFICESICPGDTLGLTVYRCNELEIVSNIHEVN